MSERERCLGCEQCAADGEMCTREMRWGKPWPVSVDVPRVKGELLTKRQTERGRPRKQSGTAVCRLCTEKVRRCFCFLGEL